MAEVEIELLLGGQKLPVQKIFQLATVHRQQLGAGAKADLLSDGAGMDCGDLDHETGKHVPNLLKYQELGVHKSSLFTTGMVDSRTLPPPCFEVYCLKGALT